MIDNIDLLILENLQKNARIKRNELAEITGLTIPSVSERLKKLETSGYIRQYTVVLDPHLFGLHITAFITVSLDSSKYYQGFIDKAEKSDEILECHSITGQGSHILKVRSKDTPSLEKMLAKIQSWPGVSGTLTNIVLSSPKETMNIPLTKPT
jgi:Lrp/AsnC family transcriptional regulator, leucine-responsive regulatory protein